MDLSKVKRYSIKSRQSKVKIENLARCGSKNSSFLDFFNSLPNILMARSFKELVNFIVDAYKNKKAVLFMFGAHVIKTGLNPLIIELMKKKIITCLSTNGASCIHDFELAFCGQTSEDVAKGLKSGRFGMAKETGDFLNKCSKYAYKKKLPLGKTIGKFINKSKFVNKHISIFNYAYKLDIPITVHIGVGTDIICQHPNYDACAWGKASYKDFLLLVENLKNLNNGGIVLNFGSTVIMPEVFIKALNLVRNLGYQVNNFVTANFDMIYHYRPKVNIVERPVENSGKGYYFIGHHEIILPLLYQSIIEIL